MRNMKHPNRAQEKLINMVIDIERVARPFKCISLYGATSLKGDKTKPDTAFLCGDAKSQKAEFLALR